MAISQQVSLISQCKRISGTEMSILIKLWIPRCNIFTIKCNMCLTISQKSNTYGVNDFCERLFLELSSTLMKFHLSRDTKYMSDVLSPAMRK